MMTWFEGDRPMRRMLAGLTVLCALVAAPAFACGPAADENGGGPKPPLAAALDAELSDAKLAGSDRDTLRALRAAIASLAAEDKMDAAREVEAQAMKILGYTKAWLNCGPGTFLWVKMSSKASHALQAAPRQL
jgi:hypothetical protein